MKATPTDSGTLITTIVLREDSTSRPYQSLVETENIQTPWILLLEQDEYLHPEDSSALLNFCRNAEILPARLHVERFLGSEAFSRFSWVTTASRMKSAEEGVRKFHTLEMRLFPTVLLGALRIDRADPDSLASFSIKYDLPGSDSVCPASVSRISSGKPPVREQRPDDRDVFRHGHQQYFDDMAFSARFEWPHTVYRTLRYDHVPSVIEALRQGLSNARIVTFTLVYLLRMRRFSDGLEMLKLIPEHWYARYPDLINGAAAFYFISGDAERALAVYDKILLTFPDADWIARNAIKLNLLAERYEAVDGILRRYCDATGEALEDDFYEEFKRVHGRAPHRTATLSACFIVRDEEAMLERAIHSIQPMADEIIVVDTGSRDRSAEIAESLGARVYHFPWSNDFSAARNFAIGQAACDYVFMLDADEYISPLFFFESKTLKKILPLSEQRAFSLQIGSYFNKTDWLFVMQDEGNFRTESNSVRIFPRKSGLLFRGRIEESIEESIRGMGIPIQILSKEILHIVHEHRNRGPRIERKLPAYEKTENPDENILLSAVRDYSALGRTEETICFLRRFWDRNSDPIVKAKLGRSLAGVSASTDPEEADRLYRELLHTFPDSPEIVFGYAEFLILNGRLKDFSVLNLEPPGGALTGMELGCLRSLQSFESGRTEEAFERLIEVLDANAYEVFPQALRLYYLASAGDLEGSVTALDTLFTLLGCRKDLQIDTVERVFLTAQELYALMLKGSYNKERFLILSGMTRLGQALGVS